MKKIWYSITEKYRAYIVCIVLIGALLPIVLNGQIRHFYVDYKNVFGDKYTDAQLFITSRPWISDSLSSYAIDSKFALAIVFPELIRFSTIQNFIEVEALFTLYVQYGALYANFSIGNFQMKPTFAELVEKDAKRLLNNKTANSIDISHTQSSRLERVKRLKSIDWQVIYLVWFVEIMDKKYRHLHFNSITEKLVFYATAYNCGYSHSENYIRAKINIKSFYTALLNASVKYNYAEISLSYFTANTL